MPQLTLQEAGCPPRKPHWDLDSEVQVSRTNVPLAPGPLPLAATMGEAAPAITTPWLPGKSAPHRAFLGAGGCSPQGQPSETEPGKWCRWEDTPPSHKEEEEPTDGLTPARLCHKLPCIFSWEASTVPPLHSGFQQLLPLHGRSLPYSPPHLPFSPCWGCREGGGTEPGGPSAGTRLVEGTRMAAQPVHHPFPKLVFKRGVLPASPGLPAFQIHLHPSQQAPHPVVKAPIPPRSSPGGSSAWTFSPPLPRQIPGRSPHSRRSASTHSH